MNKDLQNETSVNCCVCGQEYGSSTVNEVLVKDINYNVCDHCYNSNDKKNLKTLIAAFSLRNKRMQKRLDKLSTILDDIE